MNFVRVKGFPDYVIHPCGTILKIYKHHTREMKTRKDKDGYIQIQLNNNGKRTISYKYSSFASNSNEVWLFTHRSGHNWGDDGDIVIEQKIWDFFSLYSSNSTEINEINSLNNLIYITNLFGQKVIEKHNAFLFYKYDDGTTLKKIIIQ